MAEPDSIYMEHTMTFKDSLKTPTCSVGKLVYLKGRNAAVGKKQCSVKSGRIIHDFGYV